MSEYAAFLRGMNVGGHRISNVELRAHFEELGFLDVSTFRASGNVIFANGPEEPHTETAAHLETGLESALGYAVPVFLRTKKEVQEIAAQQPFEKPLIEASKGKLQVMMLSSRPTAGARKEVLGLASDEDRLAFGERELYWLPNGGMLDSELDFKLIGKLLGSATTRTKNTIEHIATKYFDG
jgi:uncharacterized protein (DUF1697 family)